MASNLPNLYVDAMTQLRVGGIDENSRNGRVKALPGPVLLTLKDPTERVLFDPNRQANPYFHVMETVWMFAGMQTSKWLEQFNSNISSFADNGFINGAYGRRWRRWTAGHDQILRAVAALNQDRTSRQVVIAMWDPTKDQYPKEVADRPCNTHLYFRVVQDKLDMLVCNRSNDVVWGMAGANAVHMTYLHELIATATRIPLGTYRVVTNNLHVYEHHWPLMEAAWQVYDHYEREGIDPYPVLFPNEPVATLLNQCERFILDEDYFPSCNWLRHVALPMREAYKVRKAGGDESGWLNKIAAPDWRLACEMWRDWRSKEYKL